MEKQEKKVWEKPIVQSLSVKGITLGGPATMHGEYYGDTGKREGWGDGTSSS